MEESKKEKSRSKSSNAAKSSKRPKRTKSGAGARKRGKSSRRRRNSGASVDAPAPQKQLDPAKLAAAAADALDGADVSAFEALGLKDSVLGALAKMGWDTPSEIQSSLIPVALTGRDILGQAKTGTGKTAAFALPILQQLEQLKAEIEKKSPSGSDADSDDGEKQKTNPVRCLMLAPTRELAGQVAEEVRRMSQFSALQTIVAYGGTRMRSQVMELKRHPDIIVGTPGRVMDLMERKLLHLDEIKFAVLDEVDRMLDIGFRDDIRKILSKISCEHQTIFVSATIEDDIKRLAGKYMTEPEEIFLAPDQLTVDQIQQCYLSVHFKDKKRLLAELIKDHKPSLAIVFTRTKRDTTFVAKYLCENGIEAREIHGDLFQRKRERIMQNFRNGKINVLVATDLASRGLDIEDITHIYNYDIPEDPEAYVHRIGRTGRMGSTGMAYLFVTPDQGDELTKIEVLINQEIPVYKLEGFKQTINTEKKVEQATDAADHMQTSFKQSEKPKARTLGSAYKPRRRRR